MKTLLIAGTDTDVGKTVLTISLTAYWQIYYPHQSQGLIKLIQTGVGDRELYHQLFSDRPSLEILSPLCFQTPIAPPLAAEREGRKVEIEKVWQALNSLEQQRDFVLVEAIGGLGSPVTRELTVADLAGSWHLNTILVVPVKLGALAQTVANVALARQSGVKLKGIVLNCSQPGIEDKLADWAPIDLIQSLTNVPVLGILPYLENLNDLEKLAQVSSNLDLEIILDFRH
jgi:dethiobiotin synthetase